MDGIVPIVYSVIDVDHLEDFVYICADKTLVYEEIGHHNHGNACKSSRRKRAELRPCYCESNI